MIGRVLAATVAGIVIGGSLDVVAAPWGRSTGPTPALASDVAPAPRSAPRRAPAPRQRATSSTAPSSIAPSSTAPSSTAPSTAAPSTAAPSTAGAPTTTAAPVVGSAPALLDAVGPRSRAVPVAVTAGGIGTDVPVAGAGVDPSTGELALPADAHSVVWYRYGVTPGEAGSAVLAGHVDHDGAEGVFFRLGEVEIGSRITVALDDGSRVTFEVVDRRSIPKPDLPVADLFRRHGQASLVLVTCGGEFDRDARSYRDNVVVTATVVPPAGAAG